MENKKMLKIASAVSSLIAVILVMVLPIAKKYSFSDLGGGSESQKIRTCIIISILASFIACVFTFVKLNRANILQIIFNTISACPILVIILIAMSNGKSHRIGSGMYLNLLFTIIAIILVAVSNKAKE